MCGRFNIIDDPFTKLLVEITGQHYSVETRFNIAPTEQVPVLVIKDETDWDLLDMRWWLIPNWAKEVSTKYSLFNAKSETLAKSSAFREPFKKRRCIVPLSVTPMSTYVNNARNKGEECIEPVGETVKVG